jgi:regulator of nonsense transcripts 2
MTDKSTNEKTSLSQEEIDQNELTQLKAYIKDKTDRLNAKLALQAKNIELADRNLDDFEISRLDSSIKKVTAFIKRLKTLTEIQKETLSKEMSQLNLSKYLSEVAAAFTEAKLKMNDIQCALHLCSQMHQNYSEFAGFLFEQWQKVLNIKKDEKINNPSKLR